MEFLYFAVFFWTTGITYYFAGVLVAILWALGITGVWLYHNYDVPLTLFRKYCTYRADRK